jgi:hypothetical protein
MSAASHRRSNSTGRPTLSAAAWLLATAIAAGGTPATAGPISDANRAPELPQPTPANPAPAQPAPIGAPAVGTDALAAYRTAVPALPRAAGGKGCPECFVDKYGPADFNKVYAVSQDGAYGAHWWNKGTLAQEREQALDSCQRKPDYDPAHPCFIFFENDKQVWRP